MKKIKYEYREAKTTGGVYTVLSPDGSKLTEFQLTADHPGVTLHITDPARVSAITAIEYLEDQAYSFLECLTQTLEDIAALDADAAAKIAEDMGLLQ